MRAVAACEAVQVKYAFIQDQLTVTDQIRSFSVNTCRRVLDVSRSGFYEWQSRRAEPDPDTTALEVAARAAHTRDRECFGTKRLRTELAAMGFVRSLATVKRLRCRHKPRFVRTTDGNHTLPIAPNLLEQKFDQASQPNQIWVTDITYVPTDEGWLYVAAIKDLFTKRIVGWAMCDHMRTSLVSQALWMAFKQECPTPGADSPQRPWQPICQRRVSSAARTVHHEGFDESTRQLPKYATAQRANGELLGEPEEGTSPSPTLPNPR